MDSQILAPLDAPSPQQKGPVNCPDLNGQARDQAPCQPTTEWEKLVAKVCPVDCYQMIDPIGQADTFEREAEQLLDCLAEFFRVETTSAWPVFYDRVLRVVLADFTDRPVPSSCDCCRLDRFDEEAEMILRCIRDRWESSTGADKSDRKFYVAVIRTVLGEWLRSLDE